MDRDFFASALDYKALRGAVYSLKERYPQVKAFSLGNSVLGRGLFAFSLGKVQSRVLYVGAVHGMEWLTAMVLLHFCEELFAAQQSGGFLGDIDVCKALENRGVVVVPCLNPDGVEIAVHGAVGALGCADQVLQWSGGDCSSWQANAHGVDLNHNFDAGYDLLKKMETECGITGPASTRYGGPYAFSEPESRALADFCLQSCVCQAYALHSQGEEIYYKYGPHTPARSRLIAELLASVSGYTVAHPQGLASHGGFKDWFIERFCAPAFTLEIGKGKNPLPASDFWPVYEKLRELLILSLVV